MFRNKIIIGVVVVGCIVGVIVLCTTDKKETLTTFMKSLPVVLGGTKANINWYPYQLSLQDTSHKCSAVIIGHKWAITAAHCIELPIASYTLRGGSSSKNSGVQYKVKNIIRHPNYERTSDYDIALLEISGKFNFNANMKPVSLTKVEPFVGQVLNVTGWDGHKNSLRLMKVSLPIITRSNCQKYYKITVTDRMLCAGKDDTCINDPGSPMVANDTLYGIVTWGCGSPGLYVNVATLRQWISCRTGIQ